MAFYKGVVNATTAWMYGAGAVNCSLLGIGERTGNVPPEAMVFVGENFNVTRAGIHADGMIKKPEIYNIFDTEAVLN